MNISLDTHDTRIGEGRLVEIVESENETSMKFIRVFVSEIISDSAHLQDRHQMPINSPK